MDFNVLYKRSDVKTAQRYALLFLIVLSLMIRAFILIRTENYHGGDTMCKVLLAMKWIKKPALMPSLIWGPFYFYLLGLSLKIWNSALISPRLVSLFFGTLTIVPFFYLIKLLFNYRIAFFSSLLLSIYAIHVKFSTLSMAEVPFLFFIVLSLYLFFLFKRNKSVKFLILSAVSVGLACMIRYEGWLLIPVMGLFMIREKRRHLLIFSCIAILSPLFLLVMQYRITGDPLFFKNYTRYNINYENLLFDERQGFLSRLLEWPIIIYYSTCPIVAIFGLVGFLYCIKNRCNLELFLIFSAFLVFFIYTSAIKNAVFDPRYAMSYAVFLFPYSIVGVDRFSSVFFKKIQRIFPMLLILYASIAFLNRLDYMIWGTSFVPDVKIVAQYLKNTEDKYGGIILDHNIRYGYNAEGIIVYSGLIPARFWTATNLKSKKVKLKDILNYLKGHKHVCLVYTDKGKISEVINLPKGMLVVEKFGYRFKQVYSTARYRIYEIEEIL